MKPVVWLTANTLQYLQGGGHSWVFLNWALGLRELGCRVVWLEGADPKAPADRLHRVLTGLRQRLGPYGLAESVALCSTSREPLPPEIADGCVELAEAREADLLLNLAYVWCRGMPELFRRSALVDIDPGLLQVWISEGVIDLERHDVYFTTGETVGRPEALFPNGGIEWHYVPPCVALDWWPVRSATEEAPFTTVSQWSTFEWLTFGQQSYRNDKRSGFEPFLDLPQQTNQPLELALCLAADSQLKLRRHDEKERTRLEAKGWRVRHAHTVSSTPWDYQRYIQDSRGEFSCAKPSCVQLQNAWVSDRTLCYLASGKPAVVQHTGPSRFLPDAAGLFRFRDVPEAVRGLETLAADYDRHCRLARALAEEHFDARKVCRLVLERALA